MPVAAESAALTAPDVGTQSAASLAGIETGRAGSAAGGVETVGFRAQLEARLDDVRRLDVAARAAATASSSQAPGLDGVRDVVLAARRAEIAYELLTQVQSQVVAAYQEIQRIQV